jgi:hypothetical protein
MTNYSRKHKSKKAKNTNQNKKQKTKKRSLRRRLLKGGSATPYINSFRVGTTQHGSQSQVNPFQGFLNQGFQQAPPTHPTPHTRLKKY